MAPQKRKRLGGSSDAGEGRPSPHRPGDTALGQHARGGDMRESGGRRPSRGGQGGQGAGRGRRNENRENPNKLTVSSRANSTPGPMSPPAKPDSATETSTPTPVVDAPSPIPKSDPAPFAYEFLTDDRVASWSTNGRADVVKAGISIRKDEDAQDLCSIFQELIRATLDVRIDATEAGECVRDIVEPDDDSISSFDPQTLFIDTLSMMCDAEGLNDLGKDTARFPAVLRTFCIATNVSTTAMRQKLDTQVVQNLGLTRDTFIRMGIRSTTNLLYRQANYNLLREESEGYSKLVTELFTTSASEPPSAEVIEEQFERIKGLIGTFDLDVGRVLDITLDVFAAVLIKHYRFFVKLLRVSSWWPRNAETDNVATSRCVGLPKWALPSSASFMSTPEDEEISKQQRRIRDTEFWARARAVGLDAFFELGGRQLVDAETKQQVLDGKSHVAEQLNPIERAESGMPSKDIEHDADREWIEKTGTYPPYGNRVAAQLLGFKLRFYSSTARDNDDILPANLIYLSALLIKIGFISLRDLYPHLWPLDEDMGKVREARMKELEEKEKANRPGGGSNALMNAGALVDDTLPNGGRTREIATTKADPVPTAPEVEDNDKLDEPMDTKVLLLTNLLTIGAVPESLFILGRFPWLPEAYPDLLNLIHRILHHSLKDVYEISRPSSTQNAECPPKPVPDFDQGGVPKGTIRMVTTSPRKQLRWPFPDRCDTGEGNNSYRFYWDEWADNVPVCQSVDDIFTLCSTFLNCSGVNIGRDAALLSKLARIGAQSLATDRSQHNLDRWQDLLKRLLVPALSLSNANTSVVNEIYDLLRYYPISIRYSIYAEWFEGQVSRLPVMRRAFARAKAETLSTMKRISKENITTMARTLAKTAYANPGIVFFHALGQIEAYTNLTEVVVECAKYFSDLGYDVLVWSLMSSLGKDRNRNNSEYALLPSRWLLALSRFSGKVFRRYSIMNLSPIVQYVNDQLYKGNSTDLVILKELIAQMAGVVPDTDFTDAQLSAMTGGELLRKQTLIRLQDKRYESTKTAKRLMRALTETKLAGQLLVSIAQHRQSAIYRIPDEDAHIKLLATMIDDSQQILFQYLDLLRSNLSVEEFDRHVPGIPELLTDFGLDPALAFLIGRASLAYRIANTASPVLNGDSEALRTAPEPSPVEINADGDAGGGNEAGVNGDQKEAAASISTDSVSSVKDDIQMTDVKGSPSTPVTSDTSDALREAIQPIVDTVRVLHQDDSWKAMTPEFYATFWTASLSDFAVPKDTYPAEIARLHKEIENLASDRSDTTRAGMARKAEAKQALEDTRVALKKEWETEIGLRLKRSTLLRKGKDSWFEPSVKPDIVSDAFLERCLIPRIKLSPSDADFCFKMIKFMHEHATPNFRTLSLYSRIFKAFRLRTLIFTCTVREAENLGRFLRLVLIDLAQWHKDAAVYEREAWGPKKDRLGFVKSFDDEGKPTGFLEYDAEKIGFKSILLNWHKALNTALRECLDGTEWMHIRNAITILKSTTEVFPAVDFMGAGFMKQLEVITNREKDTREDLSLTGNAVLVQLKKRQKTWVMVQAFGTNAVPPGKVNGNTAKAATPSNDAAKSSLKPTAPEFKPLSRASSLGVSTPKPSATTEVEDGEVDDAKTTSAAVDEKAATATAPTTAPVDTRPSGSPAPMANESRKSDILLNRDRFKEKEAAEAAKTLPPIPARNEPPRSSLLERNRNLPARPDLPIPSHDLLNRHIRHDNRRDGRLESGRSDRLSDRPREFPSNDRRGAEPPRDFGRPSDRDRGDRTRLEGPPRWTGPPTRDSHERPANGSREPDNSGRMSRENGMPPPRTSTNSTDRGPPVNPERLALLNSQRQEIINPERAALITSSNTPPRSDSPRRHRDDTRDRSRPVSPRRHISERDQEPRREDRPNRNGPEPYSRARPDEILPPPAGPRNDRSTDRGGERDRSRDTTAFQATQPMPRLVDPDHGRLNSSSRQQPDPNYGRLNPTPIPDIPSGPRDRNRGNRMVSAPQPPRRDSRPVEAPRPPTPERTVPTGPSSGRHPRRSASGQFSDPVPPTPTTPLTTSPSGVHPDRLRHLGSVVQPPEPPQPADQAPPVGVHPDRIRAFGNESSQSGPAPPQQINNRPRAPLPSVVTQAPSGPRGSQSSPISSGTNGLTAPTGPASTNDRSRGGRRQLAGINTMLQQAGQHNVPDRMNVRGRGGRINQGDAPLSGPTTPILAPSSFPPPPPPSARPEPIRDLINPARADLITGNEAPAEDRERDRGGRKSGRHSRRTSRSPAREPRPEDKSSRDYRDRSGHHSERERHGSGRGEPGRDLMAGGGRERERENRDRERDPQRRSDGRERDAGHEAPWQGGERGPERGDRGGDRGGRRGDHGGDRGGRRGDGDERGRESRGARDDGVSRKRRSEGDAMGDRVEKRPRR